MTSVPTDLQAEFSRTFESAELKEERGVEVLRHPVHGWPVKDLRTVAGQCSECGVYPSSSGNRLCEGCFDYVGWENTHSDHDHETLNNTTTSADCPVCRPELRKDLYPWVSAQPVQKRTRAAKTCRCSADCEALTNGIFAQGHDARMVSVLVKAVAAGTMTADQAEAKVRSVGGTERLVAKTRYAVANKLSQRNND